MKRPVIIDMDLTADDVNALEIAAKSHQVDIKAVTLAGADAKCAASYVKALCGQMNIDCKTAAGASKPIFKDEFGKGNIYGTYVFNGGISGSCGDSNDYPWDVIADEAEKAEGNLEIITLGPVTNIAVTLLRYPNIKPLIKHIFIAAGAGYTGNIAPYSEFNAYCDPDALQILFDSGIPLTLFPLEAAELCRSELKGDIIYAAAAMYAFIGRQQTETKDYYVVCENRNGENRGWTIIDRLGKYKKEPNVSVVTAIK